MAKISDPVNYGYSKITDKATNLVLTDDNNKPLGILYKTDLTRNTSLSESKIKIETRTFRDFFNSMRTAMPQPTPVVDLITGKEWTDQGVDNYARIDKDNTLLEARTKMKEKSPRPEMKGLVLENDKILGIITYELFSTVMIQEGLEKT